MRLRKKLAFTALTTLLFLLLVEAVLMMLPSWMGHQQKEAYKEILGGQTALLALGDSVTFGYGVEQGESWPEQLFQQLEARSAPLSVYNRAVSGMDSKEMTQRELHTITSIAQKGQRPVALVMIGHNDLVGVGYRSWSVPKGEAAEQPFLDLAPPRILRILRWISISLQHQENAVWHDPKALESLDRNLAQLKSNIDTLNGGMYLLTYLIPGGPTTEMSPEQQRLLEQGRSYQIKTNVILRDLAEKHQIPLIDLEKHVDVPTDWDSRWFMDHVHPWPIGHQKIAESVRKHLCSYGELPLTLAE